MIIAQVLMIITPVTNDNNPPIVNDNGPKFL